MVAVAVAVFRFSEFTVEIAVAVAVFGNFYSGHKISGFVETHSCNIAASQFWLTVANVSRTMVNKTLNVMSVCFFCVSD